MIEKAIEKLKTERAALSKEAKRNDADYRREISRIDTAIRKFEQGLAVLEESGKNALPRRTAAAEIERILAEKGALHVKDITAELHRRGFSVASQSVSATLQIYAKQNKKYRRTAPATFALLPNGDSGVQPANAA